MRLAVVLLALGRLGILQDSEDGYALAWKFASDASYAFHWKTAVQITGSQDGQPMPATDLTMSSSVKAKVRQVYADGGAELEGTIQRLEMKGRYPGQEVDLLFENGEFKKGGGDPDRARELQKPFRFTLSRNGQYQFKSDYPLGPMLPGQADVLGPQFPSGKAKVGHTWQHSVKSGNGPDVKVTYKLAGMDNGRAHITVDDRQPIEANGIKFDFTFKEDAVFDIDKGLCSRTKVTVDLKADAPEESPLAAFEFHGTTEMEASLDR